MNPDRSKTNTDEEDRKIVINYISPDSSLGLTYMMNAPHEQVKWIRAAMLRAVVSVERENAW